MEKANVKHPIFLFVHWVKEMVHDFMGPMFGEPEKSFCTLMRAEYCPNNFFFPHFKKRQLQGVLCLDKKVNKRNEKLTTLLCRQKGKVKMALTFTANDYELLKNWECLNK